MSGKHAVRNAGPKAITPSFDSLERRELLSGDVTALNSAGTFYLFGDVAANSVVVTNPTAGSFHIAGTNGTTVNGGASADITGITGATYAFMSLGDDSVTFQSVNLPGSLLFFGDLGDNTLTVNGTSSINGFFESFGSIGNDTVTVANTTISGFVYIDGSLGTNATSFTGGSIGASLTAYSPAGTNSLSLNATPVASYLYEYNGFGAGATTLINSNVGNFLYLYNFGGQDLGGANAGFSTATTVTGGTISGPVTLLNVLGADKTTFSGVTVHGSFYQDNGLGAATTSLTGGIIDNGVTLVGLGGADTFTLGSAAGPTAFGSSLFALMGEGANTLGVRGLTVAGNTTLIGGSGGNAITIDDSTFTGTTGITTGFGADTLNIERLHGTTAETVFTGKLTGNFGGGDDAVAIGDFPNDANAQARFHNSLSLDGGPGTDSLNYWLNFNVVDPGAPAPAFTNFESGQATTLAVMINQAPAQADPTNASPVNFSVLFNEPVTDFATGDVALSGTAGATLGTVTGSGTTYNVAVSGMTGDGTVIATINAGVAHDASSNANIASTSSDDTVTYDATPPTVAISVAAAQANPATGSPIHFTVLFDEVVTGFTTAGLTVSGTAGATTAVITGSGTTYDVAVSGMTTAGTVTVMVDAGAGADAAGNASLAAPDSATVDYSFGAVDFTTLAAPVDITLANNLVGVTLNDVQFTYDNFGSTADTASADSSGIHGSTNGLLILTFTTGLHTDLGLTFDLNGATGALTDSMFVQFSTAGTIGDTVTVPGTYNSGPGTITGTLAYTGAAFDQVDIFFSLSVPTFDLTAVTYG